MLIIAHRYSVRHLRDKFISEEEYQTFVSFQVSFILVCHMHMRLLANITAKRLHKTESETEHPKNQKKSSETFLWKNM